VGGDGGCENAKADKLDALAKSPNDRLRQSNAGRDALANLRFQINTPGLSAECLNNLDNLMSELQHYVMWPKQFRRPAVAPPFGLDYPDAGLRRRRLRPDRVPPGQLLFFFERT
jgi:hypothetical protein